MTNACAHSVVLSDGLGGGFVLQVEHSGSETTVAGESASPASMVVSRGSVQHGGGPGGMRSWNDVVMRVGATAVLGWGWSGGAMAADISSEGANIEVVATALSRRSKCLVMS